MRSEEKSLTKIFFFTLIYAVINQEQLMLACLWYVFHSKATPIYILLIWLAFVSQNTAEILQNHSMAKKYNLSKNMTEDPQFKL